MRILALVALLISLAAAGWAGQVFWQEWQVSYAPVAPRAPGEAREEEPQPPASARPTRQWPLLFGEKMPPLPPQTEEAEPEPPAPKAPPIDALGYTLKGVVRAEGQVWAMVSHPTGNEVLRVGDELAPGMVISKIDERGLWAGVEGADPGLLGFPEDKPAAAAE
ncbi:type II secretion system protein N [Roseovarius faecimaris]|nr:type II secretion system protein N [Roseovarius faecimaris]